MAKASKIETMWAAPCGVCCRLCEFFESEQGLRCDGCYSERLCRVDEPECWFVGCVEKHGVEHCGLCEKFPCPELFENHQKCAGSSPQIAVFRIGDLALRARRGTAAWLAAKINGSLPEVWEMTSRAGRMGQQEKRRHRRSRGRWPLMLSFLPASQTFGLCDITVECEDAGPSGLGIHLPEGLRENFEALVRTRRDVEVVGRFPTSEGNCPFAGKVVWHDLARSKPGDGVRLGVLLVRVNDDPTDG